jgi:hypothetical protein
MTNEERARQADLKQVKRLREYYRTSFQQGASDEAFLIWVEGALAELGGYSLDGELATGTAADIPF